MNSELLKSFIGKARDTQEALAKACGLSLSSLNAKINGHASFRQDEMDVIRKRYNMTAEDVEKVFFADEVSQSDTR